MEDTNTTLFYSLLSILFLFFAIKSILLPTKTRYKNLPPSPLALPILGHVHLLSEPFHRTLDALSKKYGPIFSLQIGSRHVVVVSSLRGAEECFGRNDVVFANRPRSTMGKYVGYDHSILGLAPYGDHWRNLRRILNCELLSTSQLNATSEIRREEIENLMRKLYNASRNGFSKIEMKTMFSELTFNIIMRIIASIPCSIEEAKRFKEIKREFFSLAVPSYPGDYFPILKWVDYNGFVKRVKKLGKEVDAFSQSLIDQHRNHQEDRNSLRKDTVIGHLLSLQESHPEYYTDDVIKSLIQEMLIAGTDTTALTLEWVMSNLLNHPRVLEKATADLEAKIDLNKLVADEDICNLPYLRSIILETQRLFPVAQLLLGHFSTDYCTIGGYDVPSGTTLLVNAWAIHRDPELWDEPTMFKPERHDEEGEERTSKLITFGMGRRACPGTNLAQRVLGLTLASLIQCFEWAKGGSERRRYD